MVGYGTDPAVATTGPISIRNKDGGEVTAVVNLKNAAERIKVDIIGY